RVLAMAALEIWFLASENLLEIPTGIPVQVLHVGGIQGVLLALQPATGQVRDGDVPYRVVPHQRTPSWQQRDRRRAHVDEDESGEFLGLVGADAAFVAEVVFRVRGILERLLDTAAARVEFPAVVLAADTIILDHAISEAGAAMRTVLVDDAEMAAAVAVDDGVLAEEFYLFRAEGGLQEFIDGANRLPVVPHERAHGCLGSYPGQELVIFDAKHGGFLLCLGMAELTLSFESSSLQSLRICALALICVWSCSSIWAIKAVKAAV